MHKLTALIRLNLAHNNLSIIPDSFSCLTMLRYLDLDFNKVPAIPTSVGKLTRLQELCLEENPIKEVSRASLAGSRNLRTLKVTIDAFDDLQYWRKDVQTFSLIAGHGVHMPPSEVIMQGSECVFKFLQLVASSRASKNLVLSRVSFWMLEMQDATTRFYTWPEEVLFQKKTLPSHLFESKNSKEKTSTQALLLSSFAFNKAFAFNSFCFRKATR